jgi:NAD(P)-dependent dehydrogenase (short-subunit alcohol dehydrogenase family)
MTNDHYHLCVYILEVSHMAAIADSGKIALVTGANKGLGYEIACALASGGALVLLGCRDKAKGAEAARRIESSGSAIPIELDVTRIGTIAAAAQHIETTYGRLDILVNNAGVSLEPRSSPSAANVDRIREVFETNVFGAIAVTTAMLPLLRRSKAGRIVNMSSSLGSLTLTSDPAAPWSRFGLLGYNTSKTALNGITVQFANELRDTPIKINAACPGYVATDLNGHSGYRSPAEGARIAVALANLPADGATGGLFNDEGRVPW